MNCQKLNMHFFSVCSPPYIYLVQVSFFRVSHTTDAPQTSSLYARMTRTYYDVPVK